VCNVEHRTADPNGNKAWGTDCVACLQELPTNWFKKTKQKERHDMAFGYELALF
jgi:hypothetical protein